MVETLVITDEAICMLIYPTRKNTENISQLLYGKRNSRLTKRLKKLKKIGWITQRKTAKDGRYTYWEATPKCMIDSFEMHMGEHAKLDDIEKEWLQEIFSSDDFKEYVASRLFEDPMEPVKSLSFSVIRKSFVLLSALILFLRQYSENNINFDTGTLMELLVNSDIENEKYTWFWNKFSSLNDFTLNKFLYLDKELSGSIMYSFAVLADIMDNRSKSN